MSEQSENKWTERWIVILMSITALSTSWSAYQANIWNGQQTSKLTEAEEARIIKTEDHLAENQHKMMDGLLAVAISTALAEGRQNAVDFLVPRLRKELRAAIEAWMAVDPVHNTAAPASPLQMPEYTENVVAKFAERQQSLSQTFKQRSQEAQDAGKAADNYVLTTVLFAVVLFFSGLASTFKSHRMEVTLLLLGTIILVLTLAGLATLPVLMD